MLLAFVIATGAAAAWFAAPILWLVTPAVAAVILRAAHAAAVETGAGDVGLQRALQRIADAALEQLRPGGPRVLLGAVIAPAATLLAPSDACFVVSTSIALNQYL